MDVLLVGLGKRNKRHKKIAKRKLLDDNNTEKVRLIMRLKR